jgi:hypothetical protein
MQRPLSFARVHTCLRLNHRLAELDMAQVVSNVRFPKDEIMIGEEAIQLYAPTSA